MLHQKIKAPKGALIFWWERGDSIKNLSAPFRFAYQRRYATPLPPRVGTYRLARGQRPIQAGRDRPSGRRRWNLPENGYGGLRRGREINLATAHGPIRRHPCTIQGDSLVRQLQRRIA